MEALEEIKQQDLLGHINSLNWCQLAATFTRVCVLAHASWPFADKRLNTNDFIGALKETQASPLHEGVIIPVYCFTFR